MTRRARLAPTLLLALAAASCPSGEAPSDDAAADLAPGEAPFDGDDDEGAHALDVDGEEGGGGKASTLWYAGSFRCLPEQVGSLVDLVDDLDHPDDYAVPTSTRRAAFATAFGGMLEAIRRDFDGLASTRGDWCRTKRQMKAAGYRLVRWWDTDSERYFLVGTDAATDGRHVAFVVNPYGKRNLVLEAPHDGADAWTASQGVRLFSELAARALLVNGAARCASDEGSPCSGETSACLDGPATEPYRASDVAHDTRSLFHVAHRAFEDRSDRVRFVQLHGFASSPTNLAMIADGSTSWDEDLGRYVPRQDEGSVATVFRDHLHDLVYPDSAFHSCQDWDGVESHRRLCATTNVQGRATNGEPEDACGLSPTQAVGRFLHLEQARTLRDDDDGDCCSWRDVAKALDRTWPGCDMRDGATDCTLGGTHARKPSCACGVDCP